MSRETYYSDRFESKDENPIKYRKVKDTQLVSESVKSVQNGQVLIVVLILINILVSVIGWTM